MAPTSVSLHHAFQDAAVSSCSTLIRQSHHIGNWFRFITDMHRSVMECHCLWCMKHRNEWSTLCPTFREARDTPFIRHYRCEGTLCSHFKILRLTKCRGRTLHSFWSFSVCVRWNTDVPAHCVSCRLLSAFKKVWGKLSCPQITLPSLSFSLSFFDSNELCHYSHSLLYLPEGSSQLFSVRRRGRPLKQRGGGRGAHWKPCSHVGMWWVYVIPRCIQPLIAVFFIEPVGLWQ